ncbi:MAG: hypothetical protein NTU45_02580 [Planctomycetota bacterium]|nr:hypothetical protein [Planctomycetota bacterium]
MQTASAAKPARKRGQAAQEEWRGIEVRSALAREGWRGIRSRIPLPRRNPLSNCVNRPLDSGRVDMPGISFRQKFECIAPDFRGACGMNAVRPARRSVAPARFHVNTDKQKNSSICRNICVAHYLFRSRQDNFRLQALVDVLRRLLNHPLGLGAQYATA